MTTGATEAIQDALVEQYVTAVLLLKKVETLLTEAQLRPDKAVSFVSTALGLIEGRQTLEVRLLEDS